MDFLGDEQAALGLMRKAEARIKQFTAGLLAVAAAVPRVTTRVARPLQFPGVRIRNNWPCPCGSGKKFKHCHKAEGKFYTVQRPTIPSTTQGCDSHEQQSEEDRQ